MDTHHEVALVFARDKLKAGCARALLSCSGVPYSDIIEQEDRKGGRCSVFFSSKLAAQGLHQKLRKLQLKDVRLSLKTHQRKDWESRWKSSWKPFALTRKIQLIPGFLSKARCPGDKRPLYLDTTAAFGTGLHETTRFSAQFIEGLEGKFMTFLDVGTGSGILTIVALMSGARYAEAFDIDRGAVKVAADNLRANGLGCDVLKASDVGRYSSRRKFDLVAANLITSDLVAFKRKIVSFVSDGGYLVISGISLAHMALVRKEYGGMRGMKISRVVKGKEWAAFLLCKR